ncbi:MAG: DNA-3-methyladenine glycosylase 2 family protein [Candidatus Nitrohelix vancouverensis]|uniref:DNA-3-methyladenine glycosylase 2 family protein n=1 Tax=Candidatus Nitrohelix vancouverensis TaxID=2705534 RepID=A0A7T0G2F8_9BACT|nr:MAG: DNA-3-methyladenine glycosylase 2 family protein [Candidatus Nitrohelix vancouverensis]
MKPPLMSPELHKQFAKIAGKFSPSLQNALLDIGPLNIPDRRKGGVAQFLSRAVVGQQLSARASTCIWLRIEAAVRENQNQIPNFFCEDNFRSIQKCGVSRNKIKTLIHIRNAHEKNQLSDAFFKRLDTEARSAHLTKIWGVGPWTAEMTSLFYFQDLNIWPEGDIAVQKTFKKFIGESGEVTAKEGAGLFSPYRSFLALYMWRIVDGEL